MKAVGKALKASDVDTRTENVFWSNVQINFIGNACWSWLSVLTENGYGRFAVGRTKYSAHRVSYALCYGFVEASDYVCHKCDNPQCVRPDHLFIGDAQTNMDDKVRKNRQPRGVQIKLARLDDTKALEIFRSPLSHRKLAKLYGVAPTTIRQIKNGQTWRHATFGKMKVT